MKNWDDRVLPLVFLNVFRNIHFSKWETFGDDVFFSGRRLSLDSGALMSSPSIPSSHGDSMRFQWNHFFFVGGKFPPNGKPKKAVLSSLCLFNYHVFFVNKYVKLVCTIYVVFRGWMCEKWTSCNKLWESVLGQKPTTERELRQCFYPFQPITDCLVNKKVSGRIETIWTFLLAKKTGCSIHLLSQQQRSGCCARQDEFSSWAWKWAKSFGVCLFPWRKHTHNI